MCSQYHRILQVSSWTIYQMMGNYFNKIVFMVVSGLSKQSIITIVNSNWDRDPYRQSTLQIHNIFNIDKRSNISLNMNKTANTKVRQYAIQPSNSTFTRELRHTIKSILAQANMIYWTIQSISEYLRSVFHIG